MIQAIDHVNIVVSDLERSVEFYTKLLDFEVESRSTLSGDWIDAVVGLRRVHADVVYLTTPDSACRLELLRYHTPPGDAREENRRPNTVGLRHLALKVLDIEAAAARLRSAGIPLFHDPISVPAEVMVRRGVRKRLLYFHDPDGVLLELAEYR